MGVQRLSGRGTSQVPYGLDLLQSVGAQLAAQRTARDAEDPGCLLLMTGSAPERTEDQILFHSFEWRRRGALGVLHSRTKFLNVARQFVRRDRLGGTKHRRSEHNVA